MKKYMGLSPNMRPRQRRNNTGGTFQVSGFSNAMRLQTVIIRAHSFVEAVNRAYHRHGFNTMHDLEIIQL